MPPQPECGVITTASVSLCRGLRWETEKVHFSLGGALKVEAINSQIISGLYDLSVITNSFLRESRVIIHLTN